jgi:hypothetical protein
MRRRVVRIDFQGAGDQLQSCGGLSSLQLDDPKQMQRVEIVRRPVEDGAIQGFGLGQAPLLVQGQGLLQPRCRRIDVLAFDDGAIP